MPKNKENCRVCAVKLTTENTSPSFLKRKFDICRRCNQNQVNDRYQKQKYKIITELLDGVCKCCGENQYEKLSIDHINGGGHQAAKKLRGKNYMIKLSHMTKNEISKVYQCLCFNCNYGKEFYGSCPHTW